MANKTSIARSAIAGALFAVPAFLLVPIESVTVSSGSPQVNWRMAQAQDDEEEGSGRETRRAMAVSDSVNQQLARVSELLEPEEDGVEPDLEGALEEANSIDPSDWNEFEQAQLWNLYGGIYVQLEEFEDAIEYYKRYVETPSVPEENMLNVSYYLAQLYLATENYPEAIELLEQYVELSEVVGADHYYRLGQAYYMNDQLDEALPNINTAVEMYEESDRLPPEGLLQYQMSLYYSSEDYPEVISVLEKLVRHYPDLGHWRTLAQVYGLAGQPMDQLHAYDATRLMGGLEEEKQVRLLGSLYLEHEYPYKGAQIIEQGMEDGIVERTTENLELLAGAWNLSRERDEAIPVLAEAAEKAEDGELFARLSQVQMSSDNHEEAIDAGEQALERGVEDPASVHLYIGMSQYNLENFEAALTSLEEASKDKDVADQAETWIQVVEGEQERLAKLEEGEESEPPEEPLLEEESG